MAARSDSKYRQILGIRFFTGNAGEAVEIGLQGGLVVVPAAPALVEMELDKPYRDALLNSDLAITDSGFMVLLWNLIKFEKITRVSGLEYLKALLAKPAFQQPHSVLWIMPTPKARDKNLAWLRSRNIPVTEEDCYLAPLYKYDNVVDPALVELIKQKKPAHIVIGLGGGVQEKLGYYIKQNVGYKPGIHCIGAAIGFLSGDQVNIPDWADHFFLGWFFRCVSEPAKFLPRYWKARRLVPILLKYRENVPAPSTA
jgi:UDP-N-acetyl-D-mannosaminuronic acid transferase (WecB/TagA/CpsF family)